MGYIPNRAARALRGVATRCIGAVIPNLTLPAPARLMELLYREAQARGFDLELHFHEWREDREQEAIRRLLAHRVDAIFLIPASLQSEEQLAPLFAAPDAPPITLFTHQQPRAALPFSASRRLYLDLPGGCRQALAHLHEKGHRRIAALLPGPFGEETHGTFFMRSVEAAARAFPDLQVHYVCRSPRHSRKERLAVAKEGQSGDAGILAAKALAATYLEKIPQESAILTTDDIHALAILDAAKAKGLRVPEDLSLISFGDTFLCDLGSLHLTHLGYHTEAAAATVLDLLLEETPSLEAGAIHYLPMHLRERDSVAAAAEPVVRNRRAKSSTLVS